MSETFDLKTWWKERTTWVERALAESLKPTEPELGNIVEMMHYSVFSGGKRFRPILTIGTTEALGKPGELALSAACAYEMVHCFSLAHDDLPCMDDDDERRGKPTVHKAFTEAGALLAGDGLSIWAFHQITQLPEGVDAAVGLQLVQDLAEASGHLGMVGGQVLDIEAQGQVPDAAGVEKIHRAKTGALIRGSVRAGALIGGASAEQLEKFTRYGELVGLVFQLTDDILDADEDDAGVSYPALIGVDATRKLVSDSTQEALDCLAGLGPQAQALRELAKFLETREG